jgi:hypothetical protein
LTVASVEVKEVLIAIDPSGNRGVFLEVKVCMMPENVLGGSALLKNPSCFLVLMESPSAGGVDTWSSTSIELLLSVPGLGP